MMVWANVKKFVTGGLVVGGLMLLSSSILTGCLTDDEKDDPAPMDMSVALTAEKKDTVWNVKGPYKGAYNLLGGVQVAEGTANDTKDIVDMAVLAGDVVTWPKTLYSLNGTTFVTAASGFDYANAKDSTLIKAFAAGGTPTTVTKVLADGDVILAKVRGGTKLAAIKIYHVMETTTDNKDYIHFGYRLTP
jgi:hypothetical protein